MALTNIYMRLVLLSGPVIGEGLLHGWETSIELKGFNFSASYEKPETKGLSLANLAAMLGVTKGKGFELDTLSFSKRFDVASSMMHTAVDMKIPVLTATITVLHMKPNAIPPHAPGLVISTQGGFLEECKLKVTTDGKLSELSEDYTLKFDVIEMLYLKTLDSLGDNPVPTAPFVHSKLLSGSAGQG